MIFGKEGYSHNDKIGPRNTSCSSHMQRPTKTVKPSQNSIGFSWRVANSTVRGPHILPVLKQFMAMTTAITPSNASTKASCDLWFFIDSKIVRIVVSTIALVDW